MFHNMLYAFDHVLARTKVIKGTDTLQLGEIFHTYFLMRCDIYT